MSTSLQYQTFEPDISIDLLERLAILTETCGDEDKKRELLWNLTDFFLESAESCDEEDQDFFGGMMEELAFGLERQVREDLARRIAAEAGMPHALIVRLANDEIPVARPLLEQSPVLTDDDLVDISRNRTQDHLLAITKREELSFRLSTVLAERGNRDVVESLLRNPNAPLPPDAIDLVAGRSRACERIQSALILRDDVPREVLLDLLGHASERVRSDIRRKLTAADEIYLDDVVDTLKFEIGTSRKSLARERIEALEQRNALNEAVVLRFLRDNKPMEFLMGLARLFSIDVKLARKILADPTGQMLVVACRASGVSFRALKEIASASITATPSDPSSLLEMSKSYERIAEEDAQCMTRAFRLRNNIRTEQDASSLL